MDRELIKHIKSIGYFKNVKILQKDKVCDEGNMEV